MRIKRIDRKNGELAGLLSIDEFRAIVGRLEQPEFVDQIVGEVCFMGGSWATAGFLYQKQMQRDLAFRV